MTDLMWGWSTGGHKSHAWSFVVGHFRVYGALCRSDIRLWTTEKTPGDERTRCRKCMKLAASSKQESNP